MDTDKHGWKGGKFTAEIQAQRAETWSQKTEGGGNDLFYKEGGKYGERGNG